MSEPDWLVYYHRVREDLRDGSGGKVVGLQSEVRYWIVGQHCHVYVLRRGTTGLLSSRHIVINLTCDTC